MWKTKKSSKKCLQNDYAYVLMVAYGQTVNKNNNNNRSLERWIFSMNSINKNNKKGFTIIEVVLVLAIAGLIFLMVFLALPALQRSQRDTQRKNDASRLRAAVTDYTSNNRGKLPWDGTALNGDFISKYITTNETTTFNDPSTNSQYTVVPATGATGAPTALGQMKVSNNAKCGTDGAIVAGSGIAVSVKTENGVANCVEG